MDVRQRQRKTRERPRESGALGAAFFNEANPSSVGCTAACGIPASRLVAGHRPYAHIRVIRRASRPREREGERELGLVNEAMGKLDERKKSLESR